MKIWLSSVPAAGGYTRIPFRLLMLYPRKSVDDAQVQAEIAAISMYNRPDPSLLMVLWERRGYLGTAQGDESMPTARTMKYIKKRSKYQFNYDVGGNVNREPLFVALADIPAINPTDVFLNGYMSMSFKDI